MFIILTYDVNEKRDAKVLKICRRYLTRVQRSVFEGCLTEATFRRLKEELTKATDLNYDKICAYCFESTRFAHRETLGKTEVHGNII